MSMQDVIRLSRAIHRQLHREESYSSVAVHNMLVTKMFESSVVQKSLEPVCRDVEKAMWSDPLREKSQYKCLLTDHL